MKKRAISVFLCTLTAAGFFTVMPDFPVFAAGNDLYVGYPSKEPNYKTVQEAVNAAAALHPTGESSRVNIHIAPGTYREQITVNTPYISFLNDSPSEQVLLTWYYGIGYQYYSADESGVYSAAKAAAHSGKLEPKKRWGYAVGLQGSADYFRADHITFENSFNRYVTDEELADGVEPSGSQKINFTRYKGADVRQKAATERGAAIAIDSSYYEFSDCTFLGSQDTLYAGGGYGYFQNCLISGNTDYIFGNGTVVFEHCELRFAGYSDNAVGGYITANKGGKYLFTDCSVTAASGMHVGSGYFGRPWGASADVAFVNTKQQYDSIITGAGWTSMSGNAPENANFKEYGTTVNGAPVNTGSRVRGTVRNSADGLDRESYLAGWIPYAVGGEQPEPEPIQGKRFLLRPTAMPALWKIADDLKTGDLLFTDREFVYTSLPAEVLGGENLMTPCDAKKLSADLAVLEATDSITVWTALDTRVNPVPGWLSDWEKTGLTASNNDSVDYALYRKALSTGETVILGANGQSSYCTGYTVFVTAAQPQKVQGDLNADGVCNNTDAALLQKWLLGMPDAALTDWENGDCNQNGKLDAADLTALKQRILASN